MKDVHLAETGGIPSYSIRSPPNIHAGQENALVFAGAPGHAGNVVDHIPAERSVGKLEWVSAAVSVRVERSGNVGVDGDDSVAGREGFHRWVEVGSFRLRFTPMEISGRGRAATPYRFSFRDFSSDSVMDSLRVAASSTAREQ